MRVAWTSPSLPGAGHRVSEGRQRSRYFPSLTRPAAPQYIRPSRHETECSYLTSVLNIHKRRRNSVNEMTSSAATRLAPQFDDFLFAPIGEEKNGMLLSVLSALARLNLDPWQEAAKLAALPVEAATERLTSLIAALPDAPSERLSPGTIAARLIRLLPRRARPDVASQARSTGAGATTNPRAIVTLVIAMMIMLAAQSILASRQPPAQVDADHASISSPASPQAPPSKSN